jgi:hypothetical protein
VRAFVAAPADVAGGGLSEWSRVSGVDASHPMVGGPRVASLGPFDVDRGRTRVLTTPEGQAGTGIGGTVMASPDGAGSISELEGWRDIFNWRGSPMPWLLAMALIFLGLMQFRVQARVAGRSASAALG